MVQLDSDTDWPLYGHFQDAMRYAKEAIVPIKFRRLYYITLAEGGVLGIKLRSYVVEDKLTEYVCLVSGPPSVVYRTELTSSISCRNGEPIQQ